jgi:hypothetical protein
MFTQVCYSPPPRIDFWSSSRTVVLLTQNSSIFVLNVLVATVACRSCRTNWHIGILEEQLVIQFFGLCHSQTSYSPQKYRTRACQSTLADGRSTGLWNNHSFRWADSESTFPSIHHHDLNRLRSRCSLATVSSLANKSCPQCGCLDRIATKYDQSAPTLFASVLVILSLSSQSFFSWATTLECNFLEWIRHIIINSMKIIWRSYAEVRNLFGHWCLLCVRTVSVCLSLTASVGLEQHIGKLHHRISL